ncbi:TraB/VirB10 family protein [Mariprofundus ferrooxydans]|jgi:conjugal transfer pilus assembly protein TraB|uniref:TraB pilus assembly n=1 Tax=Mariprofundus ferrooxydans PV-1 TaxID=314345 RepID=Q0F360_9PROT|nr:TraB/VirB10 family protein [Mariprofundus ferrooxydans]EAU56081.1 TraB pilus assembly [Mariprofundus ferrooxydans PV-1]
MSDTPERNPGTIKGWLLGLFNLNNKHQLPGDLAEQGSRRGQQWLLAGGIVLVLLVLAVISVSLSERSEESADMQPVDAPGDVEVHSITAPGAGVSDKDIWITKSESDMRNMQQEIRELRQEIDRLRQERADAGVGESHFNVEDGGSLLNPTLPSLPPQPMNAPASIPAIGPNTAPTGTTIAPITPQPINLPSGQAPATTGMPPAQNPSPPQSGGMLVVHMSPPVDEPAKENDDRSAWLAISFTPARLLNGLDAATGGQAQQNPQPVLLEVTDMTQMPNRYRENFRECFITAAGYGDISSERAYLRLEKLACIDDDGHAIEEAIDGYVTGEDGKVGMRGRLVSKQGQVLAKALLAGIASGIGDAFTQSLSTQSVSPLGVTSTIQPGAAARAGIYSGVGKALNKLADFYIQQANKLYPVIEVDAGRAVDVIINRGVRLPRWHKEKQP